MSASAAVLQAKTLTYIDIHHVPKQTVIVDTRPAAVCQKRSLAGARCLPAGDLLGADGRLPSFADIFWALGTAGLSGNESVLVAGDDPMARDFVAGVLYLSGQTRVMILDTTIRQVLQAGTFATGQGMPRAMLRQKIFRATMRDKILLLPSELHQIQERASVFRLIDASHLTGNAKAMSSLIRELKQASRQKLRYVIFSASVREAIACFTHIRATVGSKADSLRVVPVAAGTAVTSRYRAPGVAAASKLASVNNSIKEEATGGVNVYGVQSG